MCGIPEVVEVVEVVRCSFPGTNLQLPSALKVEIRSITKIQQRTDSHSKIPSVDFFAQEPASTSTPSRNLTREAKRGHGTNGESSRHRSSLLFNLPTLGYSF